MSAPLLTVIVPAYNSEDYLDRALTENPGVTTAEIVAALEVAVLPVDATKMNGATIVGDGSVANPWRGEGVHP